MPVGAEIRIVVLHNDERAVTCDALPCINDLTCSSCGDWIASATCDINPLWTLEAKVLTTFPRDGHRHRDTGRLGSTDFSKTVSWRAEFSWLL